MVLSHLGLWHDIQLAREVSGIDLIIGGHSYHRLARPVWIGETAITQAGVGGAYLGVIDIERVGTKWRIDGHLEPVWSVPTPDRPTMEATHDELRHLPHLLRSLAETPSCWADPWLENPWANFITDQLRTMAVADICWLKAAALFPVLDGGPVTEWDLRRAVPGLVLDEEMGLDDLIRMEVLGASISAVCEQVVTDLPYDLDPTIPPSACLPGNTHLQSSGLRVSYDLARPAEVRTAHSLSMAERLIRRARIRSSCLISWRRDTAAIPGSATAYAVRSSARNERSCWPR